MRREGADDFADCVIRRSSHDTIIRSKYILLMMVVSLVCAATISSFLCEVNVERGKLVEDSFTIVSLELISCLCCFLSFTLYLICRRVRDHHERDIVWRKSLIDYLASYGMDIGSLREIDSRASAGHHGVVASFSFLLWFVSVLLSVVLVLVLMVRGFDSFSLHFIIQSSYIMVLIQFICTLGTAVRYPRLHDSLQIEFVNEMQPMLEDLGINVDVIRPMVKTHRLIVNLVLFVLTFGIYALYIVGSSTTGMNRHIFSQWGYEEKLLSEIMRIEGSTGINAITGDQDSRLIIRLVKAFT